MLYSGQYLGTALFRAIEPAAGNAQSLFNGIKHSLNGAVVCLVLQRAGCTFFDGWPLAINRISIAQLPARLSALADSANGTIAAPMRPRDYVPRRLKRANVCGDRIGNESSSHQRFLRTVSKLRARTTIAFNENDTTNRRNIRPSGKTLGQVLAEAWKQAKLTQSDVARHLVRADGIVWDETYLSALEHNRR
jgi:hypothetical protein